MESTPRKVDQYSDLELMSAYWAHFGPSRGVGILGWCAVCALSGAKDGSSVLQRLKERGLSKTGLYQALTALRDFREHLEEEPLPRRDSAPALELARRLAGASVL